MVLVFVAVLAAACGGTQRCQNNEIVVGGACYPDANAACAAAGCSRDRCEILESLPAQARCKP
jgi:hypothetical protein